MDHVMPMSMPLPPRSNRRTALWAVGTVALLALPQFVGGYPIYIASLVGIYALVAIGLNLLVGFSGQISLGHAGFFALGAYASALLASKLGVPFWLAIPIAGVATALIGALIAIPALRLKNLYLAIATLGFGVVVQKMIFEWRGLTGGGAGMEVVPAQIAGLSLAVGGRMYYVILIVLAFGLWSSTNLIRTRTGRALVILRDSEIAAACLGINVARYKVVAFAFSAFYTAVAGGLLANLVRYLNPESFNFNLSIMFLAMVVIGGLGSIFGALLGAAFYVIVPELFRDMKDAPGLVFGVSLMLVMVLLPRGLASLRTKRKRRPDAAGEEGAS
ncbi:MAG: amino acid/amide transporter rane protein 2, family [Rhizobacter sp.]|nr:amino acid/amide transporter rane protein 2, family [Rhizobacter sp.]